VVNIIPPSQPSPFQEEGVLYFPSPGRGGIKGGVKISSSKYNSSQNYPPSHNNYNSYNISKIY